MHVTFIFETFFNHECEYPAISEGGVRINLYCMILITAFNSQSYVINSIIFYSVEALPQTQPSPLILSWRCH